MLAFERIGRGGDIAGLPGCDAEYQGLAEHVDEMRILVVSPPWERLRPDPCPVFPVAAC